MKRIKKFIVLVVLGAIVVASLYGTFKPLKKGISYEGEIYHNSKVEFLYDLTYEQEGMIVHQQNIFKKILQMIDEAENFIIIDMFLFNDQYEQKEEFPSIAASLTRHLINKKTQNPEIKVYFITDEINTFYGAYSSKHLTELQKNGVEVVITNLDSLRDSNPLYSGIWTTFIRWWGTEGKGWLPNAFSSTAPKVTARSYLKLLNFKANHRKVVLTEKRAMVTSANPHDASAFHSNIAFVVEGEILKDILASEQAVAAFSGQELAVDFAEKEEEKYAEMYAIAQEAIKSPTAVDTAKLEVCVLTESKIKKHLLEELKMTSQGDLIWMGMFYLADRQVIRELVQASQRGVEIRLVLDANKDAFGLEKNGIPNRPVANELYHESEKKIKIKWYKTHGEQYHTKLVMLKGRGKSVILGGSANLTRRNIGDYNLETDLKISASNDSKLVKEIENYFNKIWNNKKGVYTVDLEEYRETSLWKKFLYLFQEWTGLSTV